MTMSLLALTTLGTMSQIELNSINISQPKVGKVSISPIFYEQLFHTKEFCAAFMCLQFGFVIFWQKDFGSKASHEMLVKLTPGACVIKQILQ